MSRLKNMATFREIFDQTVSDLMGNPLPTKNFHLQLMGAASICVRDNLAKQDDQTRYQIIRSAILLLERKGNVGLPDQLSSDDREHLWENGVSLNSLRDAGVEIPFQNANISPVS